MTKTIYAIRHLDGRTLPGEYDLTIGNLILNSLADKGWYLANLREQSY